MSPEILSDPAGQFPAHYNRSSFMFPHGLSGHPLLQLPSLIDLSDRVAKYDGCYWSNGPVEVTDRWDKGTDRRQTLRETLENIAVNNSLVILKYIMRDPVVGPFFREVLSTLMQLAGPKMAQDVLIGRATILIASPHRITAYHIDQDLNYLLQIAGDKSFMVYDQSDRTLTTDEELERYFSGDDSAVGLKADRQHEATGYDLRAGMGVHVPCMAPHWARNGEQISIAVSCNYDLASVQQLSLIYKTNRRLRSLGISPRSPRDAIWSNGAKLWGARTAIAMLGRFRPQAATWREEAAWRPEAAQKH
jgi:hypothetical protein